MRIATIKNQPGKKSQRKGFECNARRQKDEVEEQIQRVINCGKMMRRRIARDQSKGKLLKQIKR